MFYHVFCHLGVVVTYTVTGSIFLCGPYASRGLDNETEAELIVLLDRSCVLGHVSPGPGQVGGRWRVGLGGGQSSLPSKSGLAPSWLCAGDSCLCLHLNSSSVQCGGGKRVYL